MEVKSRGSLHKSFMGTYIPIKHPMFIVKLLLLLSTSFLFLGNNNPLRIAALIVCIVLNAVLLKRKALALVKFLLCSTVVLIFIWCIVVRPRGGGFGIQSCLSTLASEQLHHALVRLWGLFAIGQLFAGCTSQYEILVFLRRIHAKYTVSVFIILIGNAFAYFIQLYQQISEGFRMRCSIRNPISRVFHVLTSLMLNALSLVSGCKKVEMLYQNRIRNSILRTGYGNLNTQNTQNIVVNCHFENVIYPNQSEPVIKHARLTAKTGEVILITGANGCGKTTFLNLISGIIPNIFSAAYNGKLENTDQFENSIGMVFQSVENELFFDTAESQLCHLPPETRDYWLRKFSLSYEEISNRSIMDFSNGEQQRLALLAELLDSTHSICLLDEPTAFLDADGIRVFGELLQYVSCKKIIIMVSHDSLCKQFANRHLNIINGVLQDGYWTNQISIEPFAPNAGDEGYTVPVPIDRPGRELSFTKGDIIGIVGPNGCGKTTLGKQIFWSLKKKYNKLVCTMIVQRSDQQLYEYSVIRELLLGTSEDDHTKGKALNYLRQLDLERFADQPAQFLSGGQKRALVILCMLMQTPDIIILDEPFSSLDARYAKQITDILREYYIENSPVIIICDQAHAPLTQICSREIAP